MNLRQTDSHKSLLKLANVIASALICMVFMTCNIEPENEERINLYLNDSLSFDKGHYDSLQVSFADTNGSILQPNVFRGPYRIDSTGGVLKGLLLGKSAPNKYFIRITAFRRGDSAIYEIPVIKGQAQSLVVKVSLKVPSDSTDGTVKPPTDSVGGPKIIEPEKLILSDSALTLGFTATSSTSIRVYATLKPDGSTGIIKYRSENPLFADVDENGLIRATGVGLTQIKVSVVNFPNLVGAIQIRVISPPSILAVHVERPVTTFFVGAPARQLQVSHEPSDLTAFFEYSTSDTGVFSVTNDGWIKALRPGNAVITVKAIGSTSVKDTIHLESMIDPPVLDIGSSRNVAVGQLVTIHAKVTQKFGSIRLSWDFDGDKKEDTAVTSDTATASRIFDKEGDFTVVFTAQDGEGNVATRNVRVRVGKAGPLVIITSPKSDTLVNTPNITIRFSSDSENKQQVVRLFDSVNYVTIRDTNATGIDSATVKIRLDTTKPVVKILEPADGVATRFPTLDIKWSVDRELQQTKNKEFLIGNQGPIRIRRDFTDSAGNMGSDSISIIYDTIPPNAPIFVTLDSNTNLPKPTWKWKSGGGNSNGTYSIQLDAQTEILTSKTEFSPVLDLQEGQYTLRVREQDAAGNWSDKASKTIRIKTTKPSSPAFIDASTTPSPTNNKRPKWSWKSSGTIGGGIGLFKWSVNTPNPIQKEDTSLSFTSAVDLPDGTYTLALEERDAFGNWSLPTTRSIQVLTRGAKVKIVSPTPGTFSNIRNGITNVVWQVDTVGQNFQTTDTLKKEGQWNLIRREFRDVANNITFDTVSVFWDTTAPKVLINSPTQGATVNKSTITIAWSVDQESQDTLLTEDLGNTEGIKTITRGFTDKAGNKGTASIQVTLNFNFPARTRISKILVFDKNVSGPTVHQPSRQHLNSALSELASEMGFAVTTIAQTDSAPIISNAFSEAKLSEYQVVLLSNNEGIGGLIDSVSKMNLQKFVNNGGSLFAIHAASAFINNWQWFTDALVETYFRHSSSPRANLIHDPQAIANGTASSGIFKNLTSPTAFQDEYYSFRQSPRSTPGVTILVTVDESTFNPTITVPMGADHPVVWANQIGKGNVVNFSLGHSYSSSVYTASDSYLKKLLYRVMRYSVGDFKGCMDASDSNFNPDATQNDSTQCIGAAGF